jgi:hypothetical protein
VFKRWLSDPVTDSLDALRAQHVVDSLEAINARIARVLLLLRVRIDHESDLHGVLSRQHPDYVAAHQTQGPKTVRQQRQQRLWEELRGLLSLRCDLMASSLQSLGLSMTRDIADQVESDLVRGGFAPSASGFQLHRDMHTP